MTLKTKVPCYGRRLHEKELLLLKAVRAKHICLNFQPFAGYDDVTSQND
jgi:hypothetical protein